MNEIQTTYDYAKFKKLLGNRDISKRAEKIKKSIEDYGWITNPIIVNENFEIIDGQGRFEALKTLGMPIQYLMIEGLTLADCRAMNSINTNWNYRDFLHSFAQEGNQNYARLERLMTLFDIKDIRIASRACDKGLDSKSQNKLKSGAYELSDQEYGIGYKRLAYYKKFQKVLERFAGRSMTKAQAIFIISDYPEVDPDYLYKVLSECDPSKVWVDTYLHFLESIQKIYNYGRAKKNRVHFYEKFKSEM